MRKISIFFIKFYQSTLRSVLPKSCRFMPSCSEYALEAFVKYSWCKAVWLSLRRILRCHPFNAGGHDPLT